MVPPLCYEISSTPSDSEDDDYEYLTSTENDDNVASESPSDSSSEEELNPGERALADELADLDDFDTHAEREDVAVLQEFDFADLSEENRPLSFVDPSLGGEVAELRRQLMDLETAEALPLHYPPVFSGNSISGPLVVDEVAALKELIALDEQFDGDSEDHFLEIDLYDFCVYRAPDHPDGFQGQYESLHIVSAKPEVGDWVVEGVLRSQNQQRRVRGFVDRVSIGNYEEVSIHTTLGAIWISTEVGSKQGCWYRLRDPAGGYRMLWYDFLWLADFAKHFIDYLNESSKNGKLVSLLDFKSNFWAQLREWHGDSLQGWQKHRDKKPGKLLDLRRDVLWYCQFLRHQVYSLCQDDGNDDRFQHPVWNEVGAGALSYDQQAESKFENTVVTADVAACFHEKFPHWQDKYQLLDVVEVCPEVEKFREARRQQWGFPNKFAVDQTEYFMNQSRSDSTMTNAKISLADYLLEMASAKNQPVQLRTDELSQKIVIVRMYSDNKGEYLFYYAWVRKVLSRTELAVVWLFRPSETLCGTGFYPIGNELFFSSECNCEPVHVSDVVDAVSASIISDRAKDGAVLFVHSLFDEDQQVHLSADMTKLVCHCQFHGTPKKKSQYASAQQQKGPPINTVGLFSGMGLLEHSMAATGYIRPIVAIEHWETAANTYKANDELDETEVVTASVNVCLFKIMTGEEPIRPTECITAGCPCQGYSLLNSNKATRKSQQNCSLLAHTLSWFEVLLPAYGVIENVPNMDRLCPNPCAQAICHLVALGYQVRKIFPIVSTLGGASSRERLIIMVAAPNAILPENLKETHGEGSGLMKTRTCEEAISNLDPLTNDTILNISDPDHVPIHRFKVDFIKEVNFRHVVERIPSKPAGLGVAQTFRLGRLLPSQRAWFRTLSKEQQSKNSKSLRRINRQNPFKTVCCAISPLDGRHGGEILHYKQHRTISIKEARRAMDLPDRFLMAGNIRDQYKQLGNGVPWVLGAALGRAIGKAWAATLNERPWLLNPVPDVSTTKPMNDTVSLRASASVHTHESPPILLNKSTAGIKGEIDSGDDGSVVQITKKRARYVLSDDSDGDDDEEDSDIEILDERPVPKRVR